MSYIGAYGAVLPSVRQPRAWVQIGSANIPVLTTTVTRKATRHADTFSAEMSINEAALYCYGLPQWADWDPNQDVAIVMASQIGGADTTTMISGRIDVPKITLADMKVSISSRDKSSALTESKRNQKFLNQKSSDAATQIAQDNGLNPVVTDTGDYAGKTYTTDTANLVLNRTDFETMNVLAEREGFRWYVEGDDLIFEPKDTDNGTISIIYQPPGPNTSSVGYANCSDLTLASNSTAARPHEVTYAGWHHGQKKLYKSVQTATGKGDTVKYRFHYNGNTQAQLDLKAAARLKDLIRHELSITAKMPGDLTVDPRMVAQVSGTGTIYDQTYDPDSIEWTLGWEEFFEMTIEAKGARPGRIQ